MQKLLYKLVIRDTAGFAVQLLPYLMSETLNTLKNQVFMYYHSLLSCFRRMTSI